LVIGGFGFYGDRVVETLATTNLATPESFRVFGDYDAIVNCCDSVNATPVKIPFSLRLPSLPRRSGRPLVGPSTGERR